MKSLKVFLLASLAGASFAAFADTATMEQAQHPGTQTITPAKTMMPATPNAEDKTHSAKECDAMEAKCRVTATPTLEAHDACFKKVAECREKAAKAADEAQQKMQQPTTPQPAAPQPATY